MVQPITRSQFIENLGADNLPYIQFASGFLIYAIMQVYTRVTTRLSVQSIIPLTQFGMVALLVAFWALFQIQPSWSAVGFYFFGLIYALLLISQFWTLANGIYDPRQAKRLFGFIGGGASLGGALGSGITARIHRYLGIGFALLILPVSLTLSGAVILSVGLLWTPALGSVLDRALRYTIDKTTREVLFLPLPTDIKYRAKPFVDVTVDRVAKGVGAILLLVLIKPWGLGLHWTQLTFVTFVLVVVWFVMAVRAKREYLAAFRRSIESQGVEVNRSWSAMPVADLSTVETLVEELAHPEEQRVLYAIDVLESLDKRHLITPLLLHHESASVRARALLALKEARSDIADRWVPAIEKMIGDENAAVRAAAIGTLASMRNEDAAGLARSLLEDHDPRIVATAAVVLAGSELPGDGAAAQKALTSLAADTREGANLVRRDLAAAIRQVGDSKSHDLLIPLLHDSDPAVAEEAMRSVRAFGETNFLFAPTLVSLLGNRRLKSGARETLVGYGPPVVDVLKYFLEDTEEDIWVRRHIPATLARIPSQKSMDILVETLAEQDGFLRFKVLAAMEKLRREHPSLTFDKELVEKRVLRESAKYFNRLGLHHNLFVRARLPKTSLLAHALEEKMVRTVDRTYRLLGLLYPWKDIAAARWAIEHGDKRARTSALEYLDNILASQLRRRLLPILEDIPLDEKVRRGNVILKTRPRDVEETMLELINDDDQVVAAAAIDLVGQKEMWNLTDDVEHVLEHRDPRDWYVFETASWTLASRALSPERRRQRWVEPLPAVALAERMRGLKLFASVGVDELFRIAGAGHQVRHDTGTTLLREGSVPESLHVLLDGRVVGTARRAGAREVGPPATLGFEEALDGCLMAETVRTTEPSVSLALTHDQLRTLLADNTDLVQGLFQTLAERRHARPGFIRTDAADDISQWSGELSPIQKVLALQKIPLFAKVSGNEMLYLASIARQTPLEEGAVIADQTGPFGLGIVLTGGLALTTAERPEPVAQAGPGDAVGVYETLAGLESGTQVEQLQLVVTKAGSALQIERDDLFDLLGQRPDLLQQIFAGIFDRSAPESRLIA